MAHFIGRKRELNLLKDLLNKRTASLVVVRGRRRIGKSRLIEEFGEEKNLIMFTGIPPTPSTTNQSEIDEFTRQMQRFFHIPNVQFSDWGDVFWFLGDLTKENRTILVFDEISWIGSQDPDFLGKLKNAWDLKFKKNDKMIMIFCGSVSAWIEENILQGTGFMGRISQTLTLDELPLADCNTFWRNQKDNVSNYEKFKILSVTGGVPRYLEEIRPEISAEENIKKMCFTKEGFLFKEFDQIFSNAFLSKSELYREIIFELLDCQLDASTIAQKIDVPLNNVFMGYLEELVLAGFLARDYTWNLKENKKAKLSHYRLKDNYLRFYLKNILPNHNKIESDLFDGASISSLSGWSTIMGLQFENLVLNNRKRIWELLHIFPEDIVWSNPFFQRTTKKQPGCQIDYLIQTKFGGLFVCEIKFSLKPLEIGIIQEMKQKIKNLTRPKGFSCRPVLIQVNGVQEGVIEQDYFSKIIDFGELLEG